MAGFGRDLTGRTMDRPWVCFSATGFWHAGGFYLHVTGRLNLQQKTSMPAFGWIKVYNLGLSQSLQNERLFQEGQSQTKKSKSLTAALAVS